MRILLVHGLGRTSLSLFLLARFLRGEGHHVELVGYIAAVESFARISERVRRRVEQLAQRPEPYALIGHSLGGIMLRLAINAVERPPVHLFMLGTPSRPARLAKRLQGRFLFRTLAGECGQLLGSDAFFATLPPIRVPFTVVAGTAGPTGKHSPFDDDPNDWVVAVGETIPTDQGDHITLPVTHTFLMNDRRVQETIRKVLAASC